MEMISLLLALFVLITGYVGGYAVLRKRVLDLEKAEDEALTKEKHESLCKIASLEMKKHVSDSMKDTMDEFDTKIFQPSLVKLLKAINGD